jgi:hypothetical protein
MTKIKTLTIQFDTPLRRSEIPLFRGAIIAAIPSSNILFHNHDGTSLRYSYPLIQYKRIGGKAAITCIGKGVDAMEELFVNADLNLNIGRRKVELKIESIKAEEVDVKRAPSPITYQIHSWLPLNGENHKQFHSTESMVERIKMLEQIMTGNILSLLKGLDIFIDFQLQTVITDYCIGRPITYKHLKLTNIDLTFTANIQLPQHIGIGKHSSMGAGVLSKNQKPIYNV